MIDLKIKKSVQFINMEKVKSLINKTANCKITNPIKRAYKKNLPGTSEFLLYKTIRKCREFKSSQQQPNGLVLMKKKHANQNNQQVTVTTLNYTSPNNLFSQFITNFNYHQVKIL